jgi:hypothetical protein
MWDKDFREPKRAEILRLKDIWKVLFDGDNAVDQIRERARAGVGMKDKLLLATMIHEYPYLVEPQLCLAAALGSAPSDCYMGFTRRMLAGSATDLLEEWGMLAYKKTNMKQAMAFAAEAMAGK